MSKALRTMDPVTQKAAIQRRLKEKKGGHGYFAAVDAQAHIDAAHKARKAAENAPQTPSDAGVVVTPDGNQGQPGDGLKVLQAMGVIGGEEIDDLMDGAEAYDAQMTRLGAPGYETAPEEPFHDLMTNHADSPAAQAVDEHLTGIEPLYEVDPPDIITEQEARELEVKFVDEHIVGGA
jgi:hypothetical protein